MKLGPSGSLLDQLAVGLIVAAAFGLLVGRASGSPSAGLRSRSLPTVLAQNVEPRGLIAGALIETTASVVNANVDHNDSPGFAVWGRRPVPPPGWQSD